MFNIQQFIFRVAAWARFYLNAVTKYQVHSPFVFRWITEVLEDQRFYYAFGAIDTLRRKMLALNTPVQVTDFGAGPNASLSSSTLPTLRNTTLSTIVARAGSDRRQGEMLFKMVQIHQPQYILELGTSVGLGTAYIASSAGKQATMVSLEGCPACADIARTNLSVLELPSVKVVSGAFETTLEQVVADMPRLDFVYFDGNHQEAPTLRYFEVCLPKAHEGTVFVWDDVHWSPGMENAWKKIIDHEKIRLTVDCGHFACAWFSPDHTVKQHFQIVPSSWKPWKVF